MSIVTLRLPEVKYCQEERPRRCPYCPGETFQRWGNRGRKTGQGSMAGGGVGVSISLLPLPKDVSTLSRRHRSWAADGPDEGRGRDWLDFGNELPGEFAISEYFSDPIEPDEYLAGYSTTSQGVEPSAVLEAGAGLGCGWGVCAGVGKNTASTGGGRSGHGRAGDGRLCG